MANLNERQLVRLIAGLIGRVTGSRSGAVLAAATVVVALLAVVGPDWLADHAVRTGGPGSGGGPSGKAPASTASTANEALGGDRSYWDYALPDLSGSDGGGAACPAFFDHDPGTLAAPEPPPVSDFDRAVLRACGPLGGRVSAAEFEALMTDHAEAVAEVLPAEWRDLPQAERLARLKQVWLTHEGFDHVFCGEWERGSIGGLHFRARFLQLQAEGSACLMPSDKQEIEPGQVYSIGVESADGRHRHEIKGYALHQDALDLLRIGTRTQAQCCQAGSSGWEPYRRWQSKVLRVESAEGGQPISNRVICRADDPKRATTIGLVTLYSDATPDRRSPVCKVR